MSQVKPTQIYMKKKAEFTRLHIPPTRVNMCLDTGYVDWLNELLIR
jgi:hypothetical protein